MVDLAKAVVDNGCELGLGADGDGDRIGAVDENGTSSIPLTHCLLADDVVGSEWKGPPHLRCEMFHERRESHRFSRWPADDGQDRSFVHEARPSRIS